VLCLGWGQVSLTLTPVILGQAVTAQTTNASIQQGLERYQAGDSQGAIAIWNNALSNRPTVETQIMLLTYLARGYLRVGQDDQVIAL
jgi:Rapsyn N-terminal myristoylation and linker region